MAKFLVIFSVFFVVFAVPVAASAPVLPTTGFLDIPMDGNLTAVIDGRKTTVYSSPGMPSTIYISNYIAKEIFGEKARIIPKPLGVNLLVLSVRRGPTRGANIGPETVYGTNRDVSFAIGDQRNARQEVNWFERDAYRFGDALAGPFALPDPVIRYRIRSATGGERVTHLPLRPGSEWWVASTNAVIAGQEVRFALAPQFETTVVSAAVGSLLAREYGGRFVGALSRVVIAHGVERPVRLVELSEPFALGSLPISKFLVRTRDYGNTDEIPDPNEIGEDEGAIVVTAKAKRRRPVYIVYVGRDALSHCSYIQYDKLNRVISMSCLPV